MISTISLLTAFIFASFYPLCFLMISDKQIDKGFERFNFGLTFFVAGTVAIILQVFPVAPSLKMMALLWAFVVSVSCAIVWKQSNVHSLWIIGPSLIGILTSYQIQSLYVDKSFSALMALILGGLTLCSAIYAMNLGHTYLNVPGLSIRYLMRTVNVAWGYFMLRLIWDVLGLLTQKLTHTGDVITAAQFSMRVDGFLLWVPIFFGTILPCVLMYFVRGTLKVKSTQSATGILYCVVIAVLMGDLAYKYYLLKFGIML